MSTYQISSLGSNYELFICPVAITNYIKLQLSEDGSGTTSIPIGHL